MDGVVINTDTKRTLKSDYIRITLLKNGKPSKFSLHRLLAIAFIENPNNFKIVDHIDKNKSFKSKMVRSLKLMEPRFPYDPSFQNKEVADAVSRLPLLYKADKENVKLHHQNFMALDLGNYRINMNAELQLIRS